jgi:threonine dehydrogenase-like Zn-dependent dehydrogenase
VRALPVERAAIDPGFIISHRMPLNEAPEGYDMFLNKEDECLKVVLTP